MLPHSPPPGIDASQAPHVIKTISKHVLMTKTVPATGTHETILLRLYVSALRDADRTGSMYVQSIRLLQPPTRHCRHALTPAHCMMQTGQDAQRVCVCQPPTRHCRCALTPVRCLMQRQGACAHRVCASNHHPQDTVIVFISHHDVCWLIQISDPLLLDDLVGLQRPDLHNVPALPNSLSV